MATRRERPAKFRAIGFALVFVITAHAVGKAGADTIVMRGGGQVRGKVVPHPDKLDKILVILERG